MKYLLFLMAFVFLGCAEDETEWPRTLAIQTTHHATTWKVVIVGDVTQDEVNVSIPDYATEVILIREGIGSLVVHMTPDNRDIVVQRDQDSVRIRIK